MGCSQRPLSKDQWSFYSFEHGSEELVSIIKECCSIKASIVKDDEKETLLNGKGRALLNLGHTCSCIRGSAGYGTYLQAKQAIGLVPR